MRLNLGILTFGCFACTWQNRGAYMGLLLVEYEDLKDLLNLEGLVISEYPALSLLRDSVTVAIEEYLGRELQSLERTEVVYIGAQNTTMIYLPALPVTSISSIVVSEQGTERTLTEYSDYEITEYGITTYSGIQKCKITIIYTGGLAVTTEALTRAALLQISFEFQNKEHIANTYTSTEGGSVSVPTLQLLDEVKRMLLKEKHPLRGGYI